MRDRCGADERTENRAANNATPKANADFSGPFTALCALPNNILTLVTKREQKKFHARGEDKAKEKHRRRLLLPFMLCDKNWAGATRLLAGTERLLENEHVKCSAAHEAGVVQENQRLAS